MNPLNNSLVGNNSIGSGQDKLNRLDFKKVNQTRRIFSPTVDKRCNTEPKNQTIYVQDSDVNKN